MTEYEMAYLLNELQNTVGNQASNAFTTVTAFLVAGYLTAHQLNRFMLATVIGVYTVWLSGAVINLTRTMFVIHGLVDQMREFAGQGKGLGWHVLARARAEWAFPTTLAVTLVIFTAVYVASVAFFFHCRRLNRKTEPTAPLAVTST